MDRGARDAILQHAGARRRVLDHHMFPLASGTSDGARCRLQVFAAPGLVPVVVATQLAGEGGSQDRAAGYAAEVWRRACPDSAVPPVWVQHLPISPELEPQRPFQAATFTVWVLFRLADPCWLPLTVRELEQLVGMVVDANRGDGHVPDPVATVYEPVYRMVRVDRLPPTSTYRETTTCMPNRNHRWRQRLRPPRPRPGCCWYHDQRWEAVSELAISLLQELTARGVTGEDVATEALDLVGMRGVPAADLKALETLMSPASALVVAEDPTAAYTNGNHRIRAMRDQGVRRTVAMHWQARHLGADECEDRI